MTSQNPLPAQSSRGYPLVTRTCDSCQNAFQYKANMRNADRRFCQLTCRLESQKATKVSKVCGNPSCGKDFSVKQTLIDRGLGKYCSRKCQHNARKTSEVQICLNAGCYHSFLIVPSKLNDGFGLFCSIKCRAENQIKITEKRGAIVHRLKCQQCKKSFSSIRRDVKFCSTECRVNNRISLVMEERACKKCFTVFTTPKRKTKKFCSFQCSIEYKVERSTANLMTEKICRNPLCRKKFYMKNQNLRKRRDGGKFCSRSCSSKVRESKKVKIPNIIELTCAYCKTVMRKPKSAFRGNPARAFCSHSCHGFYQRDHNTLSEFWKKRRSLVCEGA